jgi:hypothetical protein
MHVGGGRAGKTEKWNILNSYDSYDESELS